MSRWIEEPFPGIGAQHDRLQETLSPVGGNERAGAIGPEHGVKGIVLDVPKNLVVAPHDGAEDRLGFGFVGKLEARRPRSAATTHWAV